jgi:hypothetical protein
MNRVSLVCTVHKEMERANVAELHAILVHLHPDVIFLEVPAEAVADHFETCTKQNLESLAVRRYREGHPIKLVPVDLPTPPVEFFEAGTQLNRRIQDESSTYRRLLQNDSIYVRTYGFAYLNSEYNNKLWLDAYEEMANTIHRLGDPGLAVIYKSWKEKLELRDAAMMRGILEYCAQNAFDRGVFLVGAAHRQRIMEIAAEQSSDNDCRVNWDFPTCQI